MKFIEGKTLLTFNFHNSSRKDAIKFSEIIKGDWDFILLSSYCTDYEWLLGEFQSISPKTEINLIEHYDRASQPAGILRFQLTPFNRIVNLIHPKFPKFPGYGVMHCKIIILAGETFMRIVVSSANLMKFDYEQVQNIVFIQDLPRNKEASLTGSKASFLIDCQFYLALNRLLDLLGVFNDQKVIMPMDLMQKYDWSRMEAKLIYSIPEYVRFGDENASGIAMLNIIIQKYFKDSFKSNQSPITIEYQGSSLGAIKMDWLKDFEDSVKGILGNEIIAKKRIYANDYDDADADADEKIIDLTSEDEVTFCSKRFKVVFPSMRTVMKSAVGPEEFGTLFCKRKDFESADCPREVFHDCVTIPRGEPCKYSMHSKIMTVSIEGKDEKIIYRYCGSHNFTPSAWGKRGKQGSMLQITNFEVGVILDGEKFINFEYPYYRPIPKYENEDIPWDQTTL